jgi:hypothetical protein
MTDTYTARSTSSRTSAIEEPIPLNDGDETRRIVKATLVANPNNPAANLKITLMHQKRHSKKEEWQDCEAFKLVSLPKGQEVRLPLRSEETLILYTELQRLYKLAENGIEYGEKRYKVVDSDDALVIRGQQKETLRKLLANDSATFFELIEELDKGAVQRIAFIKEQEKRTAALEEFRIRMGNDSWKEPDWQRFFAENIWIFGHGLDYRVLTPVTTQPHYGGVGITGKGGQRGDYLMATEGHTKFTVLVEIKRPNTPILQDDTYRNGAYSPSAELAGGVAQLQVNAHKLNTEGARTDSARDSLEGENIYTCEPCAILVIGNTSQLIGSRDKINSFALFRKNINNPEVITFDELYAKANFIVNHSITQQHITAEAIEDESNIRFKENPPAEAR